MKARYTVFVPGGMMDAQLALSDIVPGTEDELAASCSSLAFCRRAQHIRRSTR